MRVLMYCASNRDRLIRSGDVATACNASANHIAQVVNQLSAQGYLTTRRGRTGGIELSRPATEITVGDVFSHFEAGLPLTECFDEAGNTCPLLSVCRLRLALQQAVAAFYRALEHITLDELVRDNFDLQSAFASPGCVAPPLTAGSMRRAEFVRG